MDDKFLSSENKSALKRRREGFMKVLRNDLPGDGGRVQAECGTDRAKNQEIESRAKDSVFPWSGVDQQTNPDSVRYVL